MSNFLTFIGGTIFGAYVAQNYDIPSVKKATDNLMKYIKSIEKK
tara:strand:- start:3090 stop:3221 length:132 start_codon:yes stop_codon:yes gene_type:complete